MPSKSTSSMAWWTRSRRQSHGCRGSFVIARNSAFTYKGKPVGVKQVAQELGVRYVLEGSVRKAGNRVRITGQLIDSTTGAHIAKAAPNRDRARQPQADRTP